MSGLQDPADIPDYTDPPVPAFGNGETLCHMDLLVKMDGHWQAIEIKASYGSQRLPFA